MRRSEGANVSGAFVEEVHGMMGPRTGSRTSAPPPAPAVSQLQFYGGGGHQPLSSQESGDSDGSGDETGAVTSDGAAAGGSGLASGPGGPAAGAGGRRGDALAAAVAAAEAALPPAPAGFRRRPSRAASQRTLKPKYKVGFEELVFHETIGKGSYKTVYRGRWANTNVAIVRMRKGGSVTEARMMQELSGHPNLVQFYRWTADASGNEYVVMELVPLGSLDRILAQFGHFLRSSAKFQMCEQIAAAMAALAREGVIHRDLAVRNVLVASIDPVHVKVGDFGLARETYARSQRALLQSLPVRWTPPEVILRQHWSPASDVWAFGVTMWEIFANGAEPYAALSNEEVVRKVLEGHRLDRPARCPHEVYALMTECWATDPAQRPTFDGIIERFNAMREAARSGRPSVDVSEPPIQPGGRITPATPSLAAAAAPSPPLLPPPDAPPRPRSSLTDPHHPHQEGQQQQQLQQQQQQQQHLHTAASAPPPGSRASDDAEPSACPARVPRFEPLHSGGTDAFEGKHNHGHNHGHTHGPSVSGSAPLPWESINDAMADMLHSERALVGGGCDAKGGSAAQLVPAAEAAAVPGDWGGAGGSRGASFSSFAAEGAPEVQRGLLGAGASFTSADGGSSVATDGDGLPPAARGAELRPASSPAVMSAQGSGGSGGGDDGSLGPSAGGSSAVSGVRRSHAPSFTAGVPNRAALTSPSIDRLRMMQLQQLQLQLITQQAGRRERRGSSGRRLSGAGAGDDWDDDDGSLHLSFTQEQVIDPEEHSFSTMSTFESIDVGPLAGIAEGTHLGGGGGTPEASPRDASGGTIPLPWRGRRAAHQQAAAAVQQQQQQALVGEWSLGQQQQSRSPRQTPPLQEADGEGEDSDGGPSRRLPSVPGDGRAQGRPLGVQQQQQQGQGMGRAVSSSIPDSPHLGARERSVSDHQQQQMQEQQLQSVQQQQQPEFAAAPPAPQRPRQSFSNQPASGPLPPPPRVPSNPYANIQELMYGEAASAPLPAVLLPVVPRTVSLDTHLQQLAAQALQQQQHHARRATTPAAGRGQDVVLLDEEGEEAGSAGEGGDGSSGGSGVRPARTTSV